MTAEQVLWLQSVNTGQHCKKNAKTFYLQYHLSYKKTPTNGSLLKIKTEGDRTATLCIWSLLLDEFKLGTGSKVLAIL